MLERLARIADLTASAPHSNPVLFHHSFELRALFRAHVLHAFARLRHFLAVDFAINVDLPQSRFDRRRGRCGLRLRGKSRRSDCKSCYQGTEGERMHENFSLLECTDTSSRNDEGLTNASERQLKVENRTNFTSTSFRSIANKAFRAEVRRPRSDAGRPQL